MYKNGEKKQGLDKESNIYKTRRFSQIKGQIGEQHKEDLANIKREKEIKLFEEEGDG